VTQRCACMGSPSPCTTHPSGGDDEGTLLLNDSWEDAELAFTQSEVNPVTGSEYVTTTVNELSTVTDATWIVGRGGTAARIQSGEEKYHNLTA
jgi:hypothetical protein